MSRFINNGCNYVEIKNNNQRMVFGNVRCCATCTSFDGTTCRNLLSPNNNRQVVASSACNQYRSVY